MAHDPTVELARCWRELGSILTSRRVLASIGGRQASTLTPTKLRALDLLAERGPLRVGDLAEALAVEETTATRLVDRLEQAGVAAREPVADDRRATAVALTRRGERLQAELDGRRQEFFAEVLAALEPEERSELVRLTAKATAALREELVGVCSCRAAGAAGGR